MKIERDKTRYRIFLKSAFRLTAIACLLQLAQGQTTRPQPRTIATAESIQLYPFRSAVSGNIGYIDEKGKIQIQPEIPDCKTIDPGPEFKEGRAIAGCSPFGYLEDSGKQAIEAKFDQAKPFSQGLAAAQNEDGKWGYLNKEGKFLIPPKFDDAGDFSEGLAPVSNGDLWGYIDSSGRVKVPFGFLKAGIFSQGLAPVKTSAGFGYIDKTGKAVIQPQFKAARPFHEGAAAVLTDSWHFIDSNARPAFAGSFDAAGDFSNQLAPAMPSDGKAFGYIDHSGKFVIAPQFEQADAFKGALALVVINTRRDRAHPEKKVRFYSYINTRGDKIFSGELRYIEIRDPRGTGGGTHFSIPMSPVTIESIPTGAKVYLIPLDEWELDNSIEKQSEKLLQYLQSEYTPLKDYKIIQQVYRVVFDLNGKRVVRQFDVNESGAKRLAIDFQKEQ